MAGCSLFGMKIARECGEIACGAEVELGFSRRWVSGESGLGYGVILP